MRNGPAKGSLTRDFQLQVFIMNQFPRAPQYPIKAIKCLLKFVEIFISKGGNATAAINDKSFEPECRCYWVGAYTYRMIFSKTIILRFRQTDNGSTVLSPVYAVHTSDKLNASVIDTGD